MNIQKITIPINTFKIAKFSDSLLIRICPGNSDQLNDHYCYDQFCIRQANATTLLQIMLQQASLFVLPYCKRKMPQEIF